MPEMTDVCNIMFLNVPYCFKAQEMCEKAVGKKSNYRKIYFYWLYNSASVWKSYFSRTLIFKSCLWSA